MVKINNINKDLIQEDSIISKKRKTHWYKQWYGIASCLCILLLSGIVLINNLNNTKPNNISNDLALGEGIINGEDIKYKLEIPKINLPKEDNSTVEANMVGFVVYKGKIYTEAERFIGVEAEKISSLVGEKLGYAKGNIDEWSEQSEYAEEFAGSLKGNIYSVNGYSEDFRLCTSEIQTDFEGNNVQHIAFYENLNGIGLNTGKDLFGDRLKLEGNYDYIKYLTHDNWNNGWPNYNYLDLKDISKVDIDAFIKELYNGEFVSMENSDIYDNASHHMFVYMKDKTRVELRLFEGGYVGYQALGWYFVKMPGDIFEKIYEETK